MILTQHKYLRKLLEKFGMSGAKETMTTLARNPKLKLCDGSGSIDAKLYRKVIGSLQYLSLTRPDVSICSKQVDTVHARTFNSSLDNS